MTVKKNKTVVLGAAALCVGMLGFTGCNNQVMGKRDYVPVTPDQAVAPMPEGVTPAPAVETKSPAKPETPVKPETPAKAETPKSQQTYQPMKAVASAPVRSAVSGKSGSAAVAAGGSHVVKAGETLGHIAHQYGVSSAALMQANNLDEAKAKRLKIGQKLTIPGASAKAAQGSAKSAGKASAGKASAATPAATAAKGAAGSEGTYTVQNGDSPAKIAHKLGVKESELMKANNLTAAAAKRLKVGQKLTVPGKGTAAAATTPAAATPATPGNDQLDNVLSEAEVKAPAAATPATATPAAPAAATPAAASAATAAAPAGAAPAAAAPAAEEAVPALNQIPVIVDEDTTIEAFAAKHNVTVDKLKELNPGTLPASGKLTKNLLLMVPGK